MRLAQESIVSQSHHTMGEVAEVPEDFAAAWAAVLLDIHGKTADEATTNSTNDTEARTCDER
jgi:hypothetical protein